MTTNVPIHHAGDMAYVRISEIPEPLRSKFREFMFGSQFPIIPDLPVNDAAYASDWRRFLAR